MAEDSPFLDDFEEDEVTIKINSITITVSANGKIQKARETSSRFCCGYLLGHFENEEVNIYDLIELDLSLFENVDFTLPLSEVITTEFAGIRASVPVGVNFVGFFITQPENGNLEVADHLIHILKTLEDLKYAEIYVVCLIKPSVLLWHLSYKQQLKPIENVEYKDIDISHYAIFRIRQDYRIKWIAQTGEEGFLIENTKACEASISNKSSYLIKDIKVVLYDHGNSENLPKWTGEDVVNEVRSSLDKKYTSQYIMDNVIDVSSLMKITSTRSQFGNSDNTENNKCIAPILLSQKTSGDCVSMKLSLDVLVIASRDITMQKLIYMFRDGIYRQQIALGLLIKQSHCNIVYQPVHFCHENLKLPITVMLASFDFKGNAIEEEACKSYRSTLHQRFLLPNDRPLLRRCLSAFNGRSSYHLINPHIGLPNPQIEGGKISLVDGKYSYHHYMQDNFDDNIWGCAYRSLQTLASWFWFQGYTDKKYPSHHEIQEALVEMGDKEKSFIGSNEWIGSLEVSYCLDHLYGITCRTLHVSSGSEMKFKGRELQNHFSEQGTPIMIGGGVYAHSIVGVMYNEGTGDIRYLIVDPHFTGHDQLKTVQGKGWVGWKGPDFWNQTAHYNLCMPQRPFVI